MSPHCNRQRASWRTGWKLAFDRTVRFSTTSRRRSSRQAGSASSIRKHCATPSPAVMNLLTICGAPGVPREAALEADHLQKALTALGAIGRHAFPNRSGHTNGLLKQSGIVYNSHTPAGHLPYYIADRAGKNTLLNLPFHYAIDDAQFYTFGWLGSDSPAQRMSDPDRVLEMWWAAFLQQYNKGGYLNVCLHPYVSGRALKSKCSINSSVA